MTFQERAAAIGARRRGTVLCHHVLVVLNGVYITLLFSYALMYFFDRSFFSVESRDPTVNEMFVGIMLCFPGIGLAYWDLRKLLDMVKVFSGHEEWLIGMAVDVFFDMIDKMEDDSESRTYVLLGFIVIGFLTTYISVNYVADRTGLTAGTLIACAKVHNGYLFGKDKKVAFTQWALLYFLIFTSLLCKATEGSHTDAKDTEDDPEDPNNRRSRNQSPTSSSPTETQASLNRAISFRKWNNPAHEA